MRATGEVVHFVQPPMSFGKWRRSVHRCAHVPSRFNSAKRFVGIASRALCGLLVATAGGGSARRSVADGIGATPQLPAARTSIISDHQRRDGAWMLSHAALSIRGGYASC